MDDSIDLGEKYRYIQDYPQVIIYYKTPEYQGGGVNIVPPVVLAYDFNDNYIIAKSQVDDPYSKKVKPNQYWVIDKSKNGDTVEPMDSLTFFNRLKELNLDLDFTGKE